MDIEKFSECCLAKVCRDADGHVKLTVCCVLKNADGRKVVHKKEVQLDSLIKFAAQKLAKYHADLHGEAAVSGAWDDLVEKAVQTAKRMGEARLVKALFDDLSPELASNEREQDDEESQMHRQAHDVLTKAREGDQRSLDIMAALMNAAYRGNGRALEIMSLMKTMHLALEGKEAVTIAGYECAGMTTPELVEVGSFFSRLKNVAKKVAKVAVAPMSLTHGLAHKALSKVPVLRTLAKLDPTRAAARKLGLYGFGNKKPSPAPAASYRGAPRLPGAQRMAPPTMGPPPVSPPQAYGQGGYDQGGYDQSYDQGGYDQGGYDQSYDQGGYDQGGYDQGGYDDYDPALYDESYNQEFAGPEAEVSGWLYNKGYRTVAQTVTSKFPGVGVTLREMYHRGNDSTRALAIAPIAEPGMVATVPTETPSSPSPEADVAAAGTYIVGLSWKGLMSKAKGLAKTVTTTASAIKRSGAFKVVSPILSKVAPLVANVIPGGGLAYQAALRAQDLLIQAKKNQPQAVAAIATIRKWATDGDKPSLQVAAVMQKMSDKLDQKAAALPPAPAPAYSTPAPTYAPPTVVTPVAMVRAPSYQPVAYQPAYQATAPSLYRRGLRGRWLDKHLRHMRRQPQVAGWLYNQPYRGVLEAPGAGLALREMYNRGEGRAPTTMVDVLKEVFPLGT